MEDFIERLLLGVVLFLFILCVWAVTHIPINLITESECLQQGYPESKVDMYYEGYCIRTFGDTTETKKL